MKFLVAVVLLLPVVLLAQEPAPSVADAARASRDRQRKAPPRKVYTNEDMPAAPPSLGGAPEVSDTEVRAALSRRLGKIFYYDFGSFVAALDQRHALAEKTKGTVTNLYVLPLFFDSLQLSSLDIVGRDRNVQFPDRAKWDGSINDAAANLHEELGHALPTVHAILDRNKALLGTRDLTPQQYAAVELVRKDLIDALLPAGRWATQSFLLIRDGQARLSATSSKPGSANEP